MSSRTITDQDIIQNFVDRALSGEADAFAASDEGAVSRFAQTVISEIDGALSVREWDTEDEAARAFERESARMHAAAPK